MAGPTKWHFTVVIDGSRNLKPVPIAIDVTAGATTVGQLTAAIRLNSPRLRLVEPTDIELYKVEIPREDRKGPLERTIAEIRNSSIEPMDPMAYLNEEFINGPKIGHIHVILQALADPTTVGIASLPLAGQGSGSGGGSRSQDSHPTDMDMEIGPVSLPMAGEGSGSGSGFRSQHSHPSDMDMEIAQAMTSGSGSGSRAPARHPRPSNESNRYISGEAEIDKDTESGERPSKRRRKDYSNATSLEQLGFFPLGENNPAELFRSRYWGVTNDQLFTTHTVSRDNSSGDNSIELGGGAKTIKTLDTTYPSYSLRGVLVRAEYLILLQAIITWFEPPPEGCSPEPVAEEYNPFFSFVWKRTFKRLAIVLGHPGIGKTLFLYFIAVLRFQARLTTMLQTNSGTFTIFMETGTYEIDVSSSTQVNPNIRNLTENAWFLFDSNDDVALPALCARQAPKWIILEAASPREGRTGWASKLSDSYLTFVMKPWSIQEIIAARDLQQVVATEDRLRKCYMDYGPSARTIFREAQTEGDYQQNLETAIKGLTLDLLKSHLTLDGGAYFDAKTSHKIVVLFPTDEKRRMREAAFEIASFSILKKVVERLEQAREVARSELYQLFLKQPGTNSTAGHLLDIAIHSIFSKGGAWEIVPLVSSNKNGPKNQTYYTIPPNEYLPDQPKHLLIIDGKADPIAKIQPAKTQLTNECSQLQVINYSNQLKTSGYYKPEVSNEPSLDSFIWDERYPEEAIVFQATVGQEHSVNLKGFNKLENLGVKTITYVAVIPPSDDKTSFPFPKKLEASGLVVHKAQLVLKSLD